MSKHRHPSRGHRAGRDCQRNSATLLGPGPQARYWPPTMNPAERFMVGKEEQGSGVRDTQTWVSRTKRTLRRRGYFPSLESSPPAGGISPKKRNRGFAAAAASFFLSDQKETKESPGADSPCQGEMSRSDRGGRDRGFWERPAASASVFHEPLSPGPPVLRGSQRGTWAVASGAETS